MRVSKSIKLPGTYVILPSHAGMHNAELCQEGNIKIQVWEDDLMSLKISREELELLYTKILNSPPSFKPVWIWIPLFNNGRLC